MYLRDVLTLVAGRLLVSDVTDKTTQLVLQKEVRVGGSADLMSDVLCYDMSHGLLITGLCNPQVIRTAEMADITAIVIVRGKTPLPPTASLAEQLGIPIICTPMTMYETCGRLYAAGLISAIRQEQPE